MRSRLFSGTVGTSEQNDGGRAAREWTRGGEWRTWSLMTFACRLGCGACCIAPSITTPFRGMPNGKRAGERCVHLDAGNLCLLFGHPDRPAFCGELKAEPAMCGGNDAEAMAILTQMERDTRP